jgi:hypothetical protein
MDQQPGTELLDEDRLAGHRPRGPSWLAAQPDLAEGAPGPVPPGEQPDTPTIPGGLDIGGGPQPGRHRTAVAHQVPQRIRVAAAPRQSRRETTTAFSPTDSTWTERSSSAAKPTTGWMTPLSTSRTNGSGSLATSSRRPVGLRSGTPGNGRVATCPSWCSRERAAPPCSHTAVRPTIAAATPSTPTPAATIQRATAGRPGGRGSLGPALAMPLLPNPTCSGSRP